MVTSTPNPRLWRIELEVLHTDTTKSGIVCYAYLVSNGLRLYYSHHCMYSRTVAKGPWSSGTTLRQPLGGTLKSTIECGIMSAIWDLCQSDGMEIQTWPEDPGAPITGVDLGV